MKASRAKAASLLGQIRSQAKTRAAQKNGKLGGRPKIITHSERTIDFSLPLLEMAELESELMKTDLTIADLVRITMKLLEGHKILVVGGLVLHKYARPRATYDLDLVVLASELDATGNLLIKHGFTTGKQYEYKDPHRFIHKFVYRGRDVDLIEFSDTAFVNFLFSKARPFTVFGVTARVVNPEGFVLTKLIAANSERGGKSPETQFIGQDFIDIRSVTENNTINWNIVSKWVQIFGLMTKFEALNGYLGRHAR